jgi:hypothetical protein
MAFRLRACGSNDGAVFDVFPTRCAAMRASSRFIFPIFYRPAIRNSSSMIPERFRGHAAPPLPDGADRADRQADCGVHSARPMHVARVRHGVETTCDIDSNRIAIWIMIDRGMENSIVGQNRTIYKSSKMLARSIRLRPRYQAIARSGVGCGCAGRAVMSDRQWDAIASNTIPAGSWWCAHCAGITLPHSRRVSQ